MQTSGFHPDSLIGETLDEKYLIEERLGAGGMGTVFRALHVGTQRRVAVKIITPELMTSDEYRERFKREARAAGRLQHPNVVNVTDFGVAQRSDASIAYLAMEYLDGYPLSTLLRGGTPLPLSQAIDILEQVALALDQAHRAGVVHRDLKPDNVWLRPDGRGGFEVKVLDFGVASVRELPSVGALRDIAADETVRLDPAQRTGTVSDILHTLVRQQGDPHLTRAGSVIGTPAYMSPEQCSGASADVRSDVYSLGVIAFQMLTGKLPFTGDTLELIAKHIAGTPPSPRDVHRQLPASVSNIVLTALAKDPEQRPRSALAFASALRARSEGATMVLRRALSIYTLQFDSFIRLSWLATAPLFVIVPAAAVLAAYQRGGAAYMLLASAALLSLVSVAAGLALFGVANERLRLTPCTSIRPAEIAAEVARRLGVAEPQRRGDFWKAMLRLSSKYGEADSLLRNRSDAELTVMTMVVEQLPYEAALAEAREQARALPRARGTVMAVVVPLLMLAPALAVALQHGIAGLASGSPKELLTQPSTVIIASLAFIVGVLLVLPLYGTAYAILHQRARQALARQ